MLLTILLLAFLLGHDTWLFPLLESIGLTTGSRFPKEEVGPQSVRVQSCLADGNSCEIREGEIYSSILAPANSQLVAAQLKPHPIALSAAAFAHYLAEEQASFDLPEREIRERYTKCAKLALSAEALTREVGHPLELTFPSPNQVRLTQGGAPLRDHPITMLSQKGSELRLTADQNGEAETELESGLWMARAHQISPSEAEEFDFQSLWCTLVFRQP